MKKIRKLRKQEQLIFWVFIALIIGNSAFAQIPNGDFEIFNNGICTPSSTPITDATAPFQEGCVSDWYASHGTPQIVKENGNKYALMWAGDFFNAVNCEYDQADGSEGILMRCKFLRGERYTIAMDIRIAENTNSGGPSSMESVRVYLANMSPTTEVHYCPGLTPLYQFPWVPNSQQVLNLQNVTYSNWTTVTFTFQANLDYDWLWIFPTDWANARVLLLDNVRLITCIESETYSNTYNLPPITKRSKFIRTLDNVDVLNNQNVQFIAGKFIEIKPGFEVKPGGVFTACIIDDCQKLQCGAEFPGKQGEYPETSNNNVSKFEGPTVFPNPSSGIFEMNYPEEMSITFDILSLDGKTIIHDVSVGGKASVDLHNQPRGLYFMRWFTSNNQKGTIKLIKN